MRQVPIEPLPPAIERPTISQQWLDYQSRVDPQMKIPHDELMDAFARTRNTDRWGLNDELKLEWKRIDEWMARNAGRRP